MNKAELYFYERGRYGEIARKVDLCMRHSDKPCIPPECDEAELCKRHERTPTVVDRYAQRFL